MNSPTSTTTGTEFLLFASATVRNNGPQTPVLSDVVFTPALPAACAATSGVYTAQHSLNVGINVTISPPAWRVTCSAPGTYTLTMNVAVNPSPPMTDPLPSNNSGSASDTTQVN